mgnify:CR=1 FL=1
MLHHAFNKPENKSRRSFFLAQALRLHKILLIFFFSTAHRLPLTYITPKTVPRIVIHSHMPHIGGGNTQRGGWYLQRIQPLTMHNTFIHSLLWLKTSCFQKTTSESPLIASYSPFSVCTKVSQISLTTSTTFHWISWNILRHLLVHKTHKTIELIVSQTTPSCIELIDIHGNTSSTYQLLYTMQR